ncbi:MAG: polysaccharide deacetylase family protein [Bacilli bacterium]|nr:polysaccharide deacetylase family protein [Bacilli bacterium]
MKKIFITIFVFVMVLMSIPSTLAYGWGFKRNSNNVVPDIGKYANEIEGTSSYYVGNPDEKIVYLTFDAGYDNGVLGKILDVLNEKDVKSTIFVTGDFLVREQELTLRMAYEGHTVGNHTWKHKNITKLTFEELSDEIKKVEDAYFKLTNQHMVKYFRPPAGEFNKESLKNVQKLGYSTFFWSLAYKDWETNHQRGSDYALNQVMNNIHNGAIILMHTVSIDNLEALPRIIDGIRDAGYEIKNLDYLLKNL